MNTIRNFCLSFTCVIFILCGCSNEDSNDPLLTQANETEMNTQEAAPSPTPIPDAEFESVDVETNDLGTAVAEINLDDLMNHIKSRNGKPLFLNFWATWCPPCLKEMPHIAELHKEYGKDQIEFLLVSLDSMTETVEDVPATMEEFSLEMTVRIFKVNDSDKAIRTIDAAWPGSIPATFIYDGQGKKVKRFIGSRSKQEFEDAINDVLP